MIDETARIHRLALVEGCSVGARTSIWQFASVIRGAVIGEDCNIASGACVDGSVIGDRTKIGHNLAMGPGFKVGSDCFIGPNVTFCNDAWPRAHSHNFHTDRYIHAPAVIVGDGASIGANSVILNGVYIGAGAMIAAGSVVTRNVPNGMLWKGDGRDMRKIVNEGMIQRIRFAKP